MSRTNKGGYARTPSRHSDRGEDDGDDELLLVEIDQGDHGMEAGSKRTIQDAERQPSPAPSRNVFAPHEYEEAWSVGEGESKCATCANVAHHSPHPPPSRLFLC